MLKHHFEMCVTGSDVAKGTVPWCLKSKNVLKFWRDTFAVSIQFLSKNCQPSYESNAFHTSVQDIMWQLWFPIMFGDFSSVWYWTKSQENNQIIRENGKKNPCNWFDIMVCSSKWEKTTHYISKLTSGFRPHDSHLYFSLYILCLGTSTFI